MPEVAAICLLPPSPFRYIPVVCLDVSSAADIVGYEAYSAVEVEEDAWGFSMLCNVVLRRCWRLRWVRKIAWDWRVEEGAFAEKVGCVKEVAMDLFCNLERAAKK